MHMLRVDSIPVETTLEIESMLETFHGLQIISRCPTHLPRSLPQQDSCPRTEIQDIAKNLVQTLDQSKLLTLLHKPIKCLV